MCFTAGIELHRHLSLLTCRILYISFILIYVSCAHPHHSKLTWGAFWSIRSNAKLMSTWAYTAFKQCTMPCGSIFKSIGLCRWEFHSLVRWEYHNPVKIRWFLSHRRSGMTIMGWLIFQDRREGFMKNACCFIFFCPIQKNATIFQSGKLVQTPTRSLDSPYTEHGNLHFHTEHRLNRLPHEYINTWLPLATLSVHALKLPPSHDWF